MGYPPQPGQPGARGTWPFPFSPPPGAASGPYSVVAYNVREGRWGFSHQKSTPALALQEAVQRCGADCAITRTMYDGGPGVVCFAIARDRQSGSTAWAEGSGPARPVAESLALKGCSAKGGDCAVHLWACSDGTKSTNAQATAATKPIPSLGEPGPPTIMCARAATNQARIMARVTPAVERSLTVSLTKACLVEKWSDRRIGCVLSAKESAELKLCVTSAPASTGPGKTPRSDPTLPKTPAPDPAKPADPEPSPIPPPPKPDPVPVPAKPTPPPPRPKAKPTPPPPTRLPPPAKPAPKCRGTKKWIRGKCRYPN